MIKIFEEQQIALNDEGKCFPVFAGLVYCMECNTIMKPTIVVSKGEKEIIYRCKPSCRGTDIPETLLKGMVLDGLQEEAAQEIDYETAHKLVKAINISHVETEDGYLVRSAEVCYSDVDDH